MDNTLSIINKTKNKLPSLPVAYLKKNILGEKYSLSIAYVEEKTSKSLNKKWRNKDNSTNVLSFSLSKNSGELILCPSLIKKETKRFDKNYKELLCFLIIHGMLHLKGFKHGKKMEELEEKYLSRT